MHEAAMSTTTNWIININSFISLYLLRRPKCKRKPIEYTYFWRPFLATASHSNLFHFCSYLLRRAHHRCGPFHSCKLWLIALHHVYLFMFFSSFALRFAFGNVSWKEINNNNGNHCRNLHGNVEHRSTDTDKSIARARPTHSTINLIYLHVSDERTSPARWERYIFPFTFNFLFCVIN